jgi:cyclic pyranopterin phosphate synthase
MNVHMIDIHAKGFQYREAVATGEIKLKPETIEKIVNGEILKGDPRQIAILAGIQGAKLTPSLIPLCHPIPIESVTIDFEIIDSILKSTAKVTSTAKTGVEMEALTAVSTSLLNIWDVVKMYEKDENGQYPDTEILNIKVIRKSKK